MVGIGSATRGMLAYRKSDSKPALVVVNRRASRAEAALAELDELLGRAGIDVEIQIPDDPNQIPRLVRDSAAHASCIIVGGGDGTLHHILPVVHESGLPLGILPLGTANDLARALDLPVDLAAAAQVIAAGRTRWIDLGFVGDQAFVNVASFGLTGHITQRLDEETKRRWGVLSYALSALSAIWGARPFRVEIQTDHTESFRALQVVVANGPTFGAFITLNELIELDDGLLTVCVIKAGSFWGLLRLLPHLLTGDLHSSEATVVRRCSKLEVRTSRSIRVSADGEIVSRTPTSFRVEPRALKVFVEGEQGA